MSSGTRQVVLAAYAVAAVGALWTVATTRWGGHPDRLAALTVEGGPFETATAVALAVLGVWAILRRRRWWVVAGILFVLAALEELSWGQHLFGFGTPGWLQGRNHQGEANLHNLIDSEVFSAALLTPVHVGLVVVPLLAILLPEWRRKTPLAQVPAQTWPSPHTSLILCFGWGLHAWGVPAAATDSTALVVALVFAGIAIAKSDDWRRPDVVVHWLVVCGATIVFAAAAGIYRYYNMQYEIRELFVVLGVAHWLTGWAPSRPAMNSTRLT